MIIANNYKGDNEGFAQATRWTFLHEVYPALVVVSQFNMRSSDSTTISSLASYPDLLLNSKGLGTRLYKVAHLSSVGSTFTRASTCAHAYNYEAGGVTRGGGTRFI